jgi:hypothetical protein
MSEETAKSTAAHALDLTLSVPAEGELRELAGELAAKVAEHLGAAPSEAQSLAAKVAELAARMSAGGDAASEDIAFAFRQSEREILVEARRAGKSSQVRQEIPV